MGNGWPRGAYLIGEEVGLPHDTTIIDSHSHLDDGAFDDDRAAVIARAREGGVGAIVNVGFDPARWASTAALCAEDSACSGSRPVSTSSRSSRRDAACASVRI